MINFACEIVDISPTQLVNLADTPIEILHSIENEILIPHRIALLYYPLSIPYIVEDSNIVITFSDIIFGNIDPILFSKTINVASLINIQDCTFVQFDNLINQSLILKNLGKNLTDGDGRLKVFIWYSTIDMS